MARTDVNDEQEKNHNKELIAALLLLAKKVTAINDPLREETMESIIDEYNEFLLSY